MCLQKEIVSRLERMTIYVLFITLISPRQGQNHHMLKFLAEMRQGEQVYQEQTNLVLIRR